jgi:hypothetical protein
MLRGDLSMKTKRISLVGCMAVFLFLLVVETSASQNEGVTITQIGGLNIYIIHPLEVKGNSSLVYNITINAKDNTFIYFVRLSIMQYTQKFHGGGAYYELLSPTIFISNSNWTSGEEHSYSFIVTSRETQEESHIYLELYVGSQIYGAHRWEMTEIFATTVRSPTYDSLMMDYNTLTDSYNSLNSSYTSLQASHNDLTARFNSLQTQLNTIQALMTTFVATTIIFVATTMYFATRKPKVKTA